MVALSNKEMTSLGPNKFSWDFKLWDRTHLELLSLRFPKVLLLNETKVVLLGKIEFKLRGLKYMMSL